MLARARPSGIFELLTAATWARALGYPPDELSGKSLSELMQLEKPAAGEVVAALLDEKDVQPLEVTLRCKDERRKRFRFHRRFDAYEEAMFVVADELPQINHPGPVANAGADGRVSRSARAPLASSPSHRQMTTGSASKT